MIPGPFPRSFGLLQEGGFSFLVDPWLVGALRDIGGDEALGAIERWEATGGPEREPPPYRRSVRERMGGWRHRPDR